MSRHLRLGPPDERDLAALQFTGDPVDGSAGSGQGGDLRLILRHPQRADHIDGSGVRGTGKLREQFDEEAGPHLVAHCHPTGPGGQPGDDRRRVLRLPPRQEIEHARDLANPWGLERGNHHRGPGVAWHDEHRQPFERHGGVAREVRQVVADRQQQRVDLLVGHRLDALVRDVPGTRTSRRWLRSSTQCASLDRAPADRPPGRLRASRTFAGLQDVCGRVWMGRPGETLPQTSRFTDIGCAGPGIVRGVVRCTRHVRPHDLARQPDRPLLAAWLRVLLDAAAQARPTRHRTSRAQHLGRPRQTPRSCASTPTATRPYRPWWSATSASSTRRPASSSTFLAEHQPHLLPEGFEPPEPNAASRLVSRLLG